jgi:hypothetical protein
MSGAANIDQFLLEGFSAEALLRELLKWFLEKGGEKRGETAAGGESPYCEKI